MREKWSQKGVENGGILEHNGCDALRIGSVLRGPRRVVGRETFG